MQLPIPITVRPCELNDSNAFWKPLQGCRGVLVAEDADGLVDVSVDRGSDVDHAGNPQDRFAVVKGVRKERLLLELSVPVFETLPRLTWRQQAVWWMVGCGVVVLAVAILAILQQVVHR